MAGAPDNAFPLHLNPNITSYPAPGAPPVVIQNYQVPPAQRARIYAHGLQHNGSNPPELSLSGVIWRFLVNGYPLKGLGTVTAQIGSFETPAPTVIWLTENDVFQVTVELPAASAGQEGSTGYMAEGWWAPLTSSTPASSGGAQ